MLDAHNSICLRSEWWVVTLRVMCCAKMSFLVVCPATPWVHIQVCSWLGLNMEDAVWGDGADLQLRHPQKSIKWKGDSPGQQCAGHACYRSCN